MKKYLSFVLAALLVVGFCGTAMADNTASLTDSTTTLRVYRGPVVINDADGTGTSAYVATGPVQFFAANSTNNGVSIYAIDSNRTDASGNMVKKELTAALRTRFGASGTTLVGAPVVADTWAGTGSKAGVSVFVLIAAPQTQAVGNFTGNNTLNTGVSLIALNGGSGALVWERGIALNGMVVDTALTGTSIFPCSPITLDAESASTSGVTLYGTAGTLLAGASTGASVFSVDGDTGALIGVTTFDNQYSGVSAFHAAPVISGNSLYVIGWNPGTGGVSMFALDKNKINAGVSKFTTIIPGGVDVAHWQTPTPAVSGNSIFVVQAGAGTWAGVTVYDKNTFTKQYHTQYGPIPAATGVSASPVTDGNYIVLSTLTAVTNYALTSTAGLSTNTAKWTIDLAKSYTDGTYQIWGTPAISNGYVYIPVTDTAGGNKGFVLRCTLNSTTGEAVKLTSITEMVAAEPIVSGDDVWAVTLNPTVHKITSGTGARGEVGWAQFKFDKSKTGANTRQDTVPVVPGDDDSGCFISTVK
jgi:hypothetical protein